MKNVPTLDLRDFQNNKQDFSKKVGQAYEQFGFCCFSGHNLDENIVRRAYRAFQDFFNLPDDVKRKYYHSHLAGKRGYMPFKVETAKGHNLPDLKEFWHTGRENIRDEYKSFMAENIWPTEIPEFRQASLDLYNALERVGLDILKAMAIYMNLDENYFYPVVEHGNSILRSLHYPPINSTDLPCVRAQAHEDAGLITILIAAEGAGLELLNKDGEWLPVIPKNNGVVVNVGDMMQRLTNHVFVSTTHRVVNPVGDEAKKSRYSIPFFMDPNPDFLIKTLPSCISVDNPDKYPEPILANDFLLKRLEEIKVLGK